MLILASTSDILRVVTGSAASVSVHASWVDMLSGVASASRTNTALITTATTTTVVGSPASSTIRNVRHLNIDNNHATASTTVVVQHFDGTTSVDLRSVTLLPGENLIRDTEGRWHHEDAQGAEYTYNPPANLNTGVTGTIAETGPRFFCPETNVAALTSGTLHLVGILLRAGDLVSNVITSSATTAAGTPTNYFFALYDGNRNLRAQSANQTTTAWAANTVKTLAMTTPYRVPTTGLYYIGIMVTATTVPTLKGFAAKTGAQLAGQVPILHGNSTTGLTTALPDPAAAITVGTTCIYAAVS